MHRRLPGRLTLASVLALSVACGRSELDDVEAVTPNLTPDPPVTSPPTAVYVRPTADSCPRPGVEADLRPQPEDLRLVELRILEECSGAGGQWIIGRERGTRDVMLGEHSCYFAPTTLPEPVPGLVVVRQTAGLHQGPLGWCIVDADGVEPVRSDVLTRVAAVFTTWADAEAAQRRWAR